MRANRLSHIEMLLRNDEIEAAARTFSALLGINIAPPKQAPGRDWIATTCADASIKMIAPLGNPEALQARANRELGKGAIGAIAWEVDAVERIRDYAEKERIGIDSEGENEDGGRQISLDPKACLGYRLKFVDTPIGKPRPGPGSGAAFERFNRIEFLMRAKDLEKSRMFFSKLFDVAIEPIAFVPAHHVLTRTSWDIRVELFGPGDEESVLHQILDERRGRPGATGPLVWEVQDLGAMKERATSLGHRPVYEFRYEERAQMVLNPDTLFGFPITFTQWLQPPFR